MIQKKLITVFLLIGFHSFAQLNKNKVMISGRGNIYMNNTQDRNINADVATETQFSSNVYLNAGYFLSDNFALGGVIGFGKNRDNKEYQLGMNGRTVQEIISKSYTTGIFARYNHMIRQSKFGLFVQLENTFSWGKYDDITSTYYVSGGVPSISLERQKNHTFKIGLTPGLMYYITNRMSIEASIGDISYNSTIIKNREPTGLDTQTNNQFNTSFSMTTAYFGLTFYFGGSKPEEVKDESK